MNRFFWQKAYCWAWCVTVILGGIPLAARAASAAPTPDRPNIVFIMTDDQSPFPIADRHAGQSRPFGFNGDRWVDTPTIDNLAKNGIIFTNAYVSSSVCSPSRYAILTGHYAGRSQGKRFMRLHPPGTQTRVENNTELEEQGMNIARYLQRAGYRTGFVGKCHVIDHDLLDQNNWPKNGLISYDRQANPENEAVTRAMTRNHDFWAKRIAAYGFDYVNNIYAANLRELYNEAVNVHNVEWKTKAVLDFIDQARDEPFYIYYSETVPHGPAPWEKPGGKYKFGLDADPGFTGKGYVIPDYGFMPRRSAIKAEVTRADKDVDSAWLRWFDYSVKAIVKKLKDRGKLDNTLIVITSDHGNYNFGKASLYESGVKVPLMMYWPAGIKTARVYDELVQNIDFTPTFLELAGIKLDQSMGMDGVSLAGVLAGDNRPVHEYLFFEVGYARAVCTKEWKYIAIRYDTPVQNKIDNGVKFNGWQGRKLDRPYLVRNSHLGYHSSLYHPHYFEPNQLYDRINDPMEKVNVYAGNPSQAKAMKRILKKVLTSFENRPYGEFVK